jgi:dipeptidyl aminopeptidase/acylaminoacyl peptidase
MMMKKWGFIIAMTIIMAALTAFLAKPDDFLEEKVDLGTPHLQDVDIRKITYMSDGLKVKGFLLKPVNRKEPLPLLVYNRGGMHDHGRIDHKRLSYLAAWAQKGYVVAASQYRGNGGSEGKETYGGQDVNDIINLIQLAEKLPYVDEQQKVVLGYSRGGMMTYLLMKKGIQFEAAAVVSGITDMFHFYNGRGEKVKKELRKMVGSPVVAKEKYESRSVLFWSDKINSPLLLLHGTNDQKVHHAQADRLAAQLKTMGKEHQYILYPNGDHPLNQYVEEYNQAIEEWFAAHLSH